MRLTSSLVLLFIILIVTYVALRLFDMWDEQYLAPMLIIFFLLLALLIVRRAFMALSETISSRHDSIDDVNPSREKSQNESTCEEIVWKSSE
jgi:ABC-type transport system involved in cytochrome bd biosynthesis fused ATPase/permease subunit